MYYWNQPSQLLDNFDLDTIRPIQHLLFLLFGDALLIAIVGVMVTNSTLAPEFNNYSFTTRGPHNCTTLSIRHFIRWCASGHILYGGCGPLLPQCFSERSSDHQLLLPLVEYMIITGMSTNSGTWEEEIEMMSRDTFILICITKIERQNKH